MAWTGDPRKRCGPQARGGQSTSKFLVAYVHGLGWRGRAGLNLLPRFDGATTRAKRLLWPAGARGLMYVQDLLARARVQTLCVVARGRMGLDLRPRLVLARARVQRLCVAVRARAGLNALPRFRLARARVQTICAVARGHARLNLLQRS